MLKPTDTFALNIKEKVVNGELILQFNKNRKFRMHQNAVMAPVGEWAQIRLRRLSKKDIVK